ncbi:MAG: indolepyruvate ferredoxin oxidoreductase [Desulfarculus sp.]|jgi:indolepyruvate ferredoxin oxidoreductase alpha subunit|nr:MAG: indolepyruvate ferredoxin oxidoreductase [Desulfarculus sp.]
MSGIVGYNQEQKVSKFLLGNEAIVRGALEAGVDYAAGYPGTPSSEIIERLAAEASERRVYVEWSTNEKVASEGCGAAATAGLASLAAMKNAGLSVALDFLTHFSLTGLGEQGGSMVVVVCDDPDAHSSGDETDSRWLARFAYAPLLEPTSVQEARDLTRYAFQLSRENKRCVMLRSYTRLSHASSIVDLGPLPALIAKQAHSDSSACLTPYLARGKHAQTLERLESIRGQFEESGFNSYRGPESPELLVVCSGSAYQCALEAVELLDLQERVGVLKIVTLWPFPHQLALKHLAQAGKVLALEEVDPFLENLLKEALNDAGLTDKQVLGKGSGHVPLFGEMTPDRALEALAAVFGLSYQPRAAHYSQAADRCVQELLISRGLTWCPGCPHRASFWALDRAIKAEGTDVYVTGDIGCYTLDVFPEGKCQMNLLHAMGSGLGLASGLGQLGPKNYDQPVISICGDSTFFHSSVPALINAIYNRSNLIHIVLDNDATAMTGFQAHPGVGYNALGQPTTKIDLESLCRSLGAQVEVADPFDLRGTAKTMRKLLQMKQGVRVLILRRPCELVRMKRQKNKPFRMEVDQSKCKGQECAICYSAFRCPALMVEAEGGKASIRDDACPGCGVCASICPFKAIVREEVA